MDINTIIGEFKNASYADKDKFYNSTLSFGSNLSKQFSRKTLLHSLICLVTHKMSAKDPTITTLVVLEKITRTDLKNPQTAYEHFLTSLALICNDLLYEVSEMENFGFTNSQDIINEIKNLLDEWIPF